MLNWKSVNKVYIYDGSIDGLFTIVFDAYASKTLPTSIYSKNSYLYRFTDNVVNIETDYSKSERIFKGIEKNISSETLYQTYNAFLSCQENKEMNILKYILHGFVVGPKINNMLSLDYVLNVQKLCKNVLRETDKFYGILRFIQIQNNLYYASIHPDNNIIEKLGNHFIARLPSQNFIIHDKNRNIALLYNTKNYCIIDVPNNFKITDISKEEKLFQDLWKTFFNTIAIKERTNPRLQMQYMPKKYWKDLVEKN